MTTSTRVSFDPLDPCHLADPYPTYRRLRDEAPAYYIEADDLWAVTRYEDCCRLLRDPATYSSKLGLGRLMGGGLGKRARERMATVSQPVQHLNDLRVLIAMDPPDHVRMRRLVNRPFTPRQIGMHEDRIRTLCHDTFQKLLDANSSGQADWVRDFTWPFPVMVIAELLGVPGSLRQDFKRWSDESVGMLDGLQDDPQSGLDAFIEMSGFFHEVIVERRAKPGEDLISMLVQNADEEQDPLSADELVMFCILLLIAGNETTTNLLSNMMRVFASTPEILERLRSEPALIGPTVEEVLRFDSPVQAIPRGTTRDVHLHGETIPAGSTVLVYFGAANRDERHFSEPDVFDIDRNPVDHLAFGSGIHLCLGAPLARIEAQIAIETLAKHVSTVELLGAPVPTESSILRGAKSMPIRLATP